MKFNPEKIKMLDKNAENILRVEAPYYIGRESSQDARQQMAIFFGNDFRNTPGGVNIDEYIRINNACLDFVRSNCAGLKLCYMVHPAETDEFELLDLTGFELVKDKSIRETFLYKNINTIKYVFSICSGVSRAAYEMGFNSYVFVDLFEPAFGAMATRGFKDYLAGMPESFYISELAKNYLPENRIILKKDELLEKKLTEILEKNTGTVWFLAVDPGFIIIMTVLAKLIKKISPERRIGLLLMRHKRWDLVNMEEIKDYFDVIEYFPVARLSANLKNVMNILKIAWIVKKFKIGREDIFLAFGPFSFHENCFISYFPHNSRNAVILQSTLEQSHYFETPIDASDFRIKKATILLRKILFPVLGLHRILRLQRPSGRNGFVFSRYEYPINEVFDNVFVIKST